MNIDMQRREIWSVDGHLFMVGDLELGDLNYFLSKIRKPIQMVYADPPWNKGLAKYFRTLANKYDGSIERRDVNWDSFIAQFVTSVILINPDVVWIDMSQSDSHKFINQLGGIIPFKKQVVGDYRGRPYNILLFTRSNAFGDVEDGLNGMEMTKWAYKQPVSQKCSNVLDMFMGEGLTAKMALENGKQCYGMELNPHRLEKTVKMVSKITNCEPELIG